MQICHADADLSRYMADMDRLTDVHHRVQRQSRIDELESEIWESPETKIEFFGDVASLVLDCAANQDSVTNALVKALQQAAERCEKYAVKALNEVRDHFIEVVL